MASVRAAVSGRNPSAKTRSRVLGGFSGGQSKATLSADFRVPSNLGPLRYRDALKRLQGYIDADLRSMREPDANGLILRPHMATILLAHQTPTGKGTVVMFHGYTAGPWEYPEMAQRFYKAGYNVFVPRMPGQGMATPSGTPSGAEVPKTYQGAQYERFVDKVYADTAALGGPVYAVGLSGGGSLAMDMAVRHPEVKKVAAMSLYLGPDGFVGKIIHRIIHSSHEHHWVGALLDHIPFEINVKWPSWLGSPTGKIGTWLLTSPIAKWLVNFGIPGELTPHTEASLGAAMDMLEVGRDVRKVDCPVQFLNTAGDFLSGADQVKPVFEHSGGPPRDGWFVFPQSMGVPHAMTSPKMDPVPGAAQKVQDIVFDFIDQGIRNDAGMPTC